MTEFNLSEKGLVKWGYSEANIKEFIKIIEEILNRKPDNTTSRRRDLQNRLHQIKKRAGDKLKT